MKRLFILTLFAMLGTPAPSIAAEELSKESLRTPSAKEVLDQNEGRPMEARPAEMLNDGLSLNYKAEDTEPNAEQHFAIEEYIVKNYKDGRIKILSYATEGDNEDSSARRISLERAIKVREFLKDKGIPTRHVDMFPMGDQMPQPVRDQVIIQIDKG